MARLHEHEGKALFKIAKMPIPQGEVAKTPEEARKIAEKIGKPVVIKVQIWAGGRGKAGGVKFANTPEEAEKMAAALLGMTIKGLFVEKVLVEEKLDIDKEYYAGIIVNAQADARCPVVMFSTEGGMDIESVPADKIALMNVDVIRGFKIYDALNLANKVKVPSAHIVQVARLIVGLYDTFKNYGARLIEINPMVVTKDGKVLASDCRISIDDSSVIRHPELGISCGPRVGHAADGARQDRLVGGGEGPARHLLFRRDEQPDQGGGLRDDRLPRHGRRRCDARRRRPEQAGAEGAELCRYKREPARLQGLPRGQSSSFPSRGSTATCWGASWRQTRSSGIMPTASSRPCGRNFPSVRDSPFCSFLPGTRRRSPWRSSGRGRRISMPGSGSTAATACTIPWGLPRR